MKSIAHTALTAPGLGQAGPISADASAPRRPGTDRQALLTLEMIPAHVIDLSAFTAQQHVPPPIAVSHTCLGQLLEPLPQPNAAWNQSAMARRAEGLTTFFLDVHSRVLSNR